VGNGESSGLGKTCGKGHKGQKSRSGASIRPNFEGGQMPIFRRLPKKGFNNAAFKTNFAIVNLSDLEAKFEAGDKVNEESLRACGLVQGIYDEIKVLGGGELTKSLTVEVYKASATAKAAIEKAGGTLTETEAAKAAALVEKNKKKSEKA
jgi:large subunit ribosomal protein L15